MQLTAVVEERARADDEDHAKIYQVSKSFIYINQTWQLTESHVSAVG
jgi:hypothetical protein